MVYQCQQVFIEIVNRLKITSSKIPVCAFMYIYTYTDGVNIIYPFIYYTKLSHQFHHHPFLSSLKNKGFSPLRELMNVLWAYRYLHTYFDYHNNVLYSIHIWMCIHIYSKMFIWGCVLSPVKHPPSLSTSILL